MFYVLFLFLFFLNNKFEESSSFPLCAFVIYRRFFLVPNRKTRISQNHKLEQQLAELKGAPQSAAQV